MTASQQELYAAMQNGVICHYHRYMGRFNPHPFYTRSDTWERCTVAAKGLLKLGLVERVNEDKFGSHVLRAKLEGQK